MSMISNLTFLTHVTPHKALKVSSSSINFNLSSNGKTREKSTRIPQDSLTSRSHISWTFQTTEWTSYSGTMSWPREKMLNCYRSAYHSNSGAWCSTECHCGITTQETLRLFSSSMTSTNNSKPRELSMILTTKFHCCYWLQTKKDTQPFTTVSRKRVPRVSSWCALFWTISTTFAWVRWSSNLCQFSWVTSLQLCTLTSIQPSSRPNRCNIHSSFHGKKTKRTSSLPATPVSFLRT